MKKKKKNDHYLTDIMEQTKLVCPLCGGNLTNQGQDLASNVRMEYQGDSEAKVRYFVCDKCHRDYEVFDPVPSHSK